MGIFSKFENKMEDTFDNIGDKMFDAPISPVQIAKKAEKQMRRGKMVGAGKQYAPTLYTVLVNPDDDARLSGYYPTLAGETETYLKAKANEAGLAMDGQPLVRFFTDNELKSGKFDVIAEAVSSSIVEQLRVEEITNYGIVQNPANSDMQNQQPADNPKNAAFQAAGQNAFVQPDVNAAPQQAQAPQDLPAQDNVQNNDVQNNYGQNDPFAPNGAFNQYQDDQDMQQNFNESSAPQENSNQQVSPQQNANVENQDALEEQKQEMGQFAAQNPANANVSSAAPTMVFAGGMQPTANDASRVASTQIPPAHLRDNASGKVYTLNAPTIVLGRDNTCGVVIQDANASRQHAQILFNQGVWMLNDLGSTNGTYINDQEITTRQINSGDVITIGVTHLTFNVG